MFIVANRKIILPSADGKRKHAVARGFIGEIPDWAAETAYFRALVADGKIGVPQSKKDADVEAAAVSGKNADAKAETAEPKKDADSEAETAEPEKDADEKAETAAPKAPRMKMKVSSAAPEA